MTLRRLPLAVLAAFLALPAVASAENRHSDSMSFVKNLPYTVREDLGQSIPYGTDLAFGEIRDHRYAFAGSEINGLQIVDITRPAQARIVKAYDCAVSQGDTQVFTRKNRSYVTYANDYQKSTRAGGSQCYRDVVRRGFTDAVDASGKSRLGTLIIDVTNVKKPKTVSFVSFPNGSHNMTVHPSGRYLYNSNSDLITTVTRGPAIEVVDISNLDQPEQVAALPLTPLPGLGTESHDITFNKDGTRAYSAALSHGVIIDTEDPADPSIVSEFDDESINVWHQMNPVTIGGRNFVIAEDEVAGAAAPGVCPTGGVHVFDVTDETLPLKVGYFNIDDPALRNADDTCTAHVFDIHEDEQIMTIAYYMGGVRVLDLSGLADAPIGIGQGEQTVGGAIREVGHYVMGDANAWSAKTPFIAKDGSFYLYADDINRGFDVYRYDPANAPSANAGTFVSAAAAKTKPAITLDALTKRQRSYQVYCLLKSIRQQ